MNTQATQKTQATATDNEKIQIQIRKLERLETTKGRDGGCC